jgi:hypothetical protein
MEELHLEARAVLSPERVIGAIADRLVLIPVEGLHRIGKLVRCRLVDFIG